MLVNRAEECAGQIPTPYFPLMQIERAERTLRTRRKAGGRCLFLRNMEYGCMCKGCNKKIALTVIDITI